MYEQAIDLKPQDNYYNNKGIAFMYLLGKALYRLNRYSYAIQIYEIAILLNLNPEYLINKGFYWYSIGNNLTILQRHNESI